MPFSGLPIPPSNVPVVDPRTGDMALQWKNYYLALQAFIAASIAAPIDAKYWTSTGNTVLTDETNIGALPTGYLKITTALGVATPSTTALIPASDVSPAPPPNTASYWTSTAEPALSAETNLGALASGYLKQVTVAGVATPSTTPTIPASDISPPPPTNAATFWTSTAEPGLSAETNMGALPTGYLRQTTAAGVATPATVTSIPATDIGSGAALTGTNDVNVTITLTGSPAAALLAATGLTMGWTGLLGVARGGTGANNTTQVYTPTALNLGNVTSTTIWPCQYLRVGNAVTVSGQIDILPTTAGVLTLLGLSIPVVSIFTSSVQCAGTAVAPLANMFGAFNGETSTGTGRAQLLFIPTITTSQAWLFTFTYLVV